jgi:hypothetical protein
MGILDSYFLKAVGLSFTFRRRGSAALPFMGRALLPQRPKISNIFGQF